MHFPKILVLGATGQIGEILRKFWPNDRATWQTRRAHRGSDWITAELSNDQALKTAAQGKSVILCLAGVTPARVAQGGDFDDNIALALAAVRAGASVGARVLVTSSAAVYGNQAGTLDENTPLLPQSQYGRAKAEMEQRAIALGQELGVAVCALRIGNVAGVDAILGGWRPGFQLDQFPNGHTPARSYIGPETLAQVILDLVNAIDLPSVLNVSAPGTVEMGQLLDAAGLQWVPRPAPETAIAQVCLSTGRLQRFTQLHNGDSLPETMVTQWRSQNEP